jgi:exopolyphosphatase/guanosine-5'-triphosphate,3'-diphosphate pyrophosphatase
MTVTTQPLAVIDLGTNTFHLLIARPDDSGSFTELFRERRFIKLAEDGITRIGQGPWERGLTAMRAFADQLAFHGVTQVRAIGTAALRTAGNGAAFIDTVKEETGIQIELIDGDEEARLIHQGASLAIPFTERTRLLMDIGGGSVEFILADADQVFWAQSFPIGVAVLFRDFHTEDPLSDKQQKALRAFLAKALEPLEKALKAHPVTELLGASGTFDVLEQYLDDSGSGTDYTTISITRFAPFRDQLIAMPLPERLTMERMPPARAEMIPVALVLLDVVIELAGIEQLLVSPYALKEGELFEMMNAE